MSKTVVLTAGHSNKRPGVVANGYREEAVATEFREMVAGRLRAMGLKVITDGQGEENHSLRYALKLIPKGDLAIEFHTNGFADKRANGCETISLPEDKALSQSLSAAVAGVLGTRLRGKKGWIDQSKTAHRRLAYVRAGGIIMEPFFLTNKRECVLWQKHKEEVADEVADVVYSELMLPWMGVLCS